MPFVALPMLVGTSFFHILGNLGRHILVFEKYFVFSKQREQEN